MVASPILPHQFSIMDVMADAGVAVTPAHFPANIPVRAFMDPDALVAEPAFFVRFLDVLHATDAIRASHRRTVELLGIGDGFQLLDAGCGTGNFAREVASLVGPAGRVVGVDLSGALIAVARQRAVELSVPVEFRIADAQALPFADASFDGCRVERALQYLDEPRRALAEMVRVTKPGGRIVAAEVDWDTIVGDLPGVDRDVYRRARQAMSDSAGNGWMGRELRRHFLDLGLDDVTCEGFVVIFTDAGTVLDDIGRRVALQRVRDVGAISADECARLIAAAEAAGDAGNYFSAFTLFLVSGRLPAH
jgi:SAM-dependent methyltransferase